MLNKFLQSSKNPQELSLMIKGVLTASMPLAGVVLKATGHEIDNETLKDIIEKVGDVVIAFGSAVSAVMIVWGALRKTWNKPTS